jgi:ZIP family zinc transporter
MGFGDATLGALMVLFATSLGSAVVLLFRCIDKKLYSIMLSFSAGIMAFSVVEILLQSHSSAGYLTMLAGIALGVGVLLFYDKFIPHLHARMRNDELSASKKKAMLLTGAIMLHNVPEGFAVGSAFASSNPLGWLVALSISLQDVPEGLLISAPLVCYGIKMKRSFGFGILSGVVEALAALAGFVFLTAINSLIPLGLAFSGGAMLYVILAELIPDAFTKGFERISTISFITGFVLAFGLASIFFY